jgi:hypothetical protein
VLAPRQPGGTAERRKVDQHDQRPILDRHRPAAPTARRPLASGLDVDQQRAAHLVDDAEHPHRRQSDQQLAHAPRVNFHRGSPELDGFDTIKFAEPLLRARDGHTPLISEAPSKSDYHRIAARRGKKIAAVAVGRKILTLVFYGLRDGEVRCLAEGDAA